jgi:hypothetical protein
MHGVVLLRQARGHALDLRRGDRRQEVGDIRRRLFGQGSPALDNAVAQRQCVVGRGLAGDELPPLAQQGDVIGQLGLAMPGVEAQQAFARQCVLLGRHVDVLVDPPARQAVGIAVAEAHGATALQQDAEDGNEQQVANETVHGRGPKMSAKSNTDPARRDHSLASGVSFLRHKEDIA